MLGDELSTGQPELDERQPLLSNLPAITCKKCSINALLVLLLVVLLFGGLGIAIWLAILSNTKGGGNIGPDKNFVLVKRSSWGARTADLPSELSIPHTPVDYIIIIHTDTTICNTSASCVNQMRVLQNHSMDNKHLSDIPYNFLIGGDGNVYEGRGFKIQGAFVPKWNIKSFGLAFIAQHTLSKKIYFHHHARAGTARATVLSLPGSPAFLPAPSYVRMHTTVEHHVAGTVKRTVP
uniref:Peptidoglycan recognition protein family domain-containing protein n=1 Tax=Timema shepardi TaxID=629360 RepID=A0A7R9B5W4_TIMSH|nr:unnamed protein product [Timema shepardi]